MEYSFDQTALAEWIKLVDEEKTLQSTEGVSNEDKKIMKVRVVMEMVNLLPGLSDQEKANLIVSLIQKENIQEVTVEDPERSEDPGISESESESN